MDAVSTATSRIKASAARPGKPELGSETIFSRLMETPTNTRPVRTRDLRVRSARGRHGSGLRPSFPYAAGRQSAGSGPRTPRTLRAPRGSRVYPLVVLFQSAESGPKITLAPARVLDAREDRHAEPSGAPSASPSTKSTLMGCLSDVLVVPLLNTCTSGLSPSSL